MVLNKTLLEQNRLAFEQNSALEFNSYDIDNFVVLVGAENSLFILDILQTIKDVSVQDQQHLDDNGNIRNVLTINTYVADLMFSELFNPLLSSSSESYYSIFSGLTEYRESQDSDYSREIANIRTESVHINSPSIPIDSHRSGGGGQSSGSRMISIFHINPSQSEQPSLEEVHTRIQEQSSLDKWRQEMTRNWCERIQLIFSNQNPYYQPLPSWFDVPTRPTNPSDLERWEKDNIMRRFWTTRLNGGYLQTDIVIRDSPYDSHPGHTYDHLNHTWESSEEYDWFNEGYKDLAEEYAPINVSKDVWAQDDFNLELLFKD